MDLQPSALLELFPSACCCSHAQCGSGCSFFSYRSFLRASALLHDMLEYAVARAPQAIFSYSHQLKGISRQTPLKFYAQMEARRQQLSAK